MQDSIRLSIIVPCYNLYGYVDKTIASLLNQNVEKNQYEIILVDDGSTDNTLEVIEKLANENSNVRVISQQNAGVSRARNNGLKNALGKYVWFVDGDDIIQKNCFKFLIDVLEKENADFIQFNIKPFSDGEKIPKMSFSTDYKVCSDNKKVYKFTYGKTGGGVWNNVFNREFLINHRITFSQDIKYSEDVLFSFLAILNANKVVKTDQVLYYYRQRQSSAMHQAKPEIFIDSMLKLALEYNELSKIQDKKWKKICKSKRNFATKALLFSIIQTGDVKIAKENLRILREKKLYPYPLLFESLVGNKTFKQGLINYVSFFFPCKLYFYICVIIRGLFKRKK